MRRPYTPAGSMFKLLDPAVIFESNFEIAYADIKDEIVMVQCDQHDTKFDYIGG